MRLKPSSRINFSLAGLLALADISTIKQRIALQGSSYILDTLLLVPGIHTQQEAPKVNGGELPKTCAMTTGYVFRTENQATVNYFQKIAKKGSLTTVEVESEKDRFPLFRVLFPIGDTIPSLLYFAGISLTVTSLSLLILFRDFWAMGILLILMFSQLVNTVLTRRRAQIGWKGQLEPGVHGDLLIVLEDDACIRMRGLTDDLKAVTAGQWMRELNTIEGYLSSSATMLVYIAAALSPNSSAKGGLCLAVLLLTSVAMLGLCNTMTQELHMFGRRVHIVEGPKKYKSEKEMVAALLKEPTMKCTSWVISMGFVKNEEELEALKNGPSEPVAGPSTHPSMLVEEEASETTALLGSSRGERSSTTYTG
ncbi:hypothetical protein NM688_g8616 [Phlebia brevispora]|uniref:Uncharacterized protein n=1 Tax=Phlebia brevispora TaxID=194682 RepID=A0ACC1RQ09_9APHY|nr:hypothetical protein NM688_g8616 [Phlebia brevispora]